MLDGSTRFKPTPEVSSHGLEGDVVLVHLRTGQYYTVRGVGLDLWEAINSERGSTISDMVSDLIRRYPDAESQIPGDVDEFVSALLAMELIAPC